MNAAMVLVVGCFSLAGTGDWGLGTGNRGLGIGNRGLGLAAGDRGPVIRPQFAICNLQFAICNCPFRLPPSAFRLLFVADAAVESGRKALDHWFRYPWYDSQRDGVRRVDVAPPLADTAPHRDFEMPILEVFLRWAIWMGLGLLLAAIAYLLLRAYLHRRRDVAAGSKAPAPDTADTDHIESLPFSLRTGRLDLLEEARRHYQQGNYAQAIVYLFSYQLVQLDRQQVIRLARGKTNRQYLREIGSRAPLVRLFEQTMVAFEDVFFGNRALERGRFELYWSRLEEFQSLAGAAKA